MLILFTERKLNWVGHNWAEIWLAKSLYQGGNLEEEHFHQKEQKITSEKALKWEWLGMFKK